MSTRVSPVEIDRSRAHWPMRRRENWFSGIQSLEDWMAEMESRWLPRSMYFPFPHSVFGHRTPRVDVIERSDELCVRAEMPGVEKDNIEVNLCDDMLTIKASVKKEKKEQEEDYIRCEILHDEYHRALTLPISAMTEKAVASFHDGILEVVIPKKPGHGAKKIEIQ